MTVLETHMEMETSELHPIDVVQYLAQHQQWKFDRLCEDQISMVIEGAWRHYDLTLAWSAQDETLRLIAVFDLDAPDERMSLLYELLNHVNDQSWSGNFSYWDAQGLMSFRYGLTLSGEVVATQEQIETILCNAVGQCERYYPSFQLICWGDETPESAMQMAIGQTCGNA